MATSSSSVSSGNVQTEVRCVYHGKGDLLLECPVAHCPSIHPTVATITKHLKKHHTPQFEQITTKNLTITYTCSQCSFSTTGLTQHHISKHYKTCKGVGAVQEGNKGRFCCPACGTRWALLCKARHHFNNVHFEYDTPPIAAFSGTPYKLKKRKFTIINKALTYSCPLPLNQLLCPLWSCSLTILNKPLSSVQQETAHGDGSQGQSYVPTQLRQVLRARCHCGNPPIGKGHWASCQGKRPLSSPKGGRSSPTPPANLTLHFLNYLPFQLPSQSSSPQSSTLDPTACKARVPIPSFLRGDCEVTFFIIPSVNFYRPYLSYPLRMFWRNRTSSGHCSLHRVVRGFVRERLVPHPRSKSPARTPLEFLCEFRLAGVFPDPGKVASLRPVPAPLTLCLSPPVAGPMISCEDHSAPPSVRSSSPIPNSPASVSSVEAHLSDLLDKVSSGELRPLSPTLPSSGFFGPLLPPTPPPRPTPSAEKASPSGLSYLPCREVKIASIARPSPASQRVGCDADRTGPSLNPNYQQTSPPSTPSFSPIVRPPKFPRSGAKVNSKSKPPGVRPRRAKPIEPGTESASPVDVDTISSSVQEPCTPENRTPEFFYERKWLVSILNIHEREGSNFFQFNRDLEYWTQLLSGSQKGGRAKRASYNRGAANQAMKNRDSGRKDFDPRPVAGHSSGGGTELGSRPRYPKGARLRADFWRDMKGTVRKLLDGSNGERRCGIPLDIIERKFRQVSMPGWIDHRRYAAGASPSLVTQAETDVAITSEEVEAVLSGLNVQSAPGSDGLSYRFWKGLDPSGRLLSCLFEIVRRHGRIPGAWPTCSVILLCKDAQGDVQDVGNWRPITICRTLYKLYAAVIARRIQTWAKQGGVLSRLQKGFMPVEGVFEHVFMLDTVLSDAKLRRKNLLAVFLDVRNAFGSVRHECLLKVLRHFDAPHYLVELVRDIYTGATCRVRSSVGETGDIPCDRGVRQGYPLSGILFNLVTEVLIPGLSAGNDGYRMACLGGKLTQVLAYADDLVVVTENRDQMLRQLGVCEEFGRWAGLAFNQRKCGLIGWRTLRGGRRVALEDPLLLNGVEIPLLRPGEHYKYLGAMTGVMSVPRTGSQLIKDFRARLQRLFTSFLTPHQKLIALKRFLLPSLSFHLRVRPIARSELIALDRRVRECLRVAFRLTKPSCQAVFHTPTDMDGLGVPSVCSESSILTIAQGFKVLTSPDGTVSATASARVKLYAAKFGGLTEAGPSDWARYLSGDDVNGNSTRKPGANLPSGLWTRVRCASRQLGAVWRVCPENGITVRVRNSVITSRDRRKLIRSFHDCSNQQWKEQWMQHPNQEKTAAAHMAYADANRWVKQPSVMEPHTYFFALRARLNLLPTRVSRAIYSRDQHPDILCRRCGASVESLPHVLNHCPPNMSIILGRHNLVLQEVLNAVDKTQFKEISVDRTVPEHMSETGEALRPDIVARRNDGSVVVVDVACPFDQKANFDEAAKRKLLKYDKLCCNIAASTGKPVECHSIVVGSLGSLAEGLSTSLRALGITDFARSKLVACHQG
uniref:Reverse transcriptase n=1 Tax=Ciona intestinalis TaxID=7719 RepID=Q76IM9_CIOIN|nr:reverse transcriptase [Ciona intestinalis]